MLGPSPKGDGRLILPVGLDESRLARIPWVSIAIATLCALVWLLGLLAGRGEGEGKLRDAVAYWEERPYLELPREARQILRLDAAGGTRRAGRAAEPPSPLFQQMEQRELDGMVSGALDALDAHPQRRFALVPARGAAQPGWLTHLFLHGGLGHLLGNMIVFLLVVGPFLEDVWGRPFFLGFYLLGGLAAGLAQAVPMGDSPIGVVGASGAISACLGAFMLRFAHRRVRFFYWVFLLFRGTFFVPAWLYALFGIGLDLLGLRFSGVEGGVAYAAHVGGFFFGMLVALGVRLTRLEDRIAPEGAVRWAGTLGAARAADALAEGRHFEAREHYRKVLHSHPDDEEALLGIARIEMARLDWTAARDVVERLVARRIASADGPGLSSLLGEFAEALRPDLLRPVVAYRVGAALERTDPARAVAFYEAAAAGGGELGIKAGGRVEALARGSGEAPPSGRMAPPGPEEEPIATAPASPPAAPVAAVAPPGLIAASDPVRLATCRLLAAGPEGLAIAAPDGRTTRLGLSTVEALAVGLLPPPAPGGRPVLLADLLLRGRRGEGRLILRIPGSGMDLAAIRPGLAGREAFAALVDDVLSQSGAVALPGPEEARGRPFARYPDAGAFEEACWGRRIAP